MSASLEARPRGEGPSLSIRGAAVHNLQQIDVDIPLGQMTVLSGLSGSGKSSLAVDLIVAEGQRQYLESLSVFARQFFHQRRRPDVRSICGLQPTVCIDQRVGSLNPRSTVGTLTDLHDFLRVLYARMGVPHCPHCARPIRPQSVERIVEQLLELPERTRLLVLAPLVRGRPGAHREVFESIRRQRLVRVRIDGEVHDVDALPELNARRPHTIEAVVDRIVIHGEVVGRLSESVRLAVELSGGSIAARFSSETNAAAEAWDEREFHTQWACLACGRGISEIEPRSFSFNSPYGACPVCEGLGARLQYDPDRVLPDRSRSLKQNGVAPWAGLSAAQRRQRLAALRPRLQALAFDETHPLAQLSAAQLEGLMFGGGKHDPGLALLLERERSAAVDSRREDELSALRVRTVCEECGGSRLRRESRAVTVADHTLPELNQLPVSACQALLASWSFPGRDGRVAARLLPEIIRRLGYLEQVGLGYVTLGRAAETLSGGELQRARLASAIGSGLSGACFVLDEPSIGLHPADHRRLLEALRELQRQGNTLIVVEHDEETVRSADWVIDLGPGAGRFGGRIVAEGPPASLAVRESSWTADYLAGRRAIPAHTPRPAAARSLNLRGARGNNLRGTDVAVPLERLVCVAGVSGSGKSTLVHRTLVPAVVRHLGLAADPPFPLDALEGAEGIERVVALDQRPIGRSSRGCAATYTGVLDEIRPVMARTPAARQFGLTAAHFSFNSPKGWCADCRGLGTQRLEMRFLPDAQVECPACQGRRYNPSTLRARFRDRSIADILAMPVGEALPFFEGFERIRTVLQTLSDVGLDYLPLGQSSTTLSGGEAQRIRLASELSRGSGGGGLYVLDEPTTGLHVEDVRRLLEVLQRLVEQRNTVIVVEHHLDVIRNADWVIELGPGGGEAGGCVVAVGPPAAIAACPSSPTGRFLSRERPETAAKPKRTRTENRK